MTIVFSNVSPKTPKLGIFGPIFKDFCFCTKLDYKTKSRALITKRTIVFQNCSSNYPNKSFLVPNLSILTFEQTLQLDILEGVDYKNDNSFLTFQPKDPIEHFWS